MFELTPEHIKAMREKVEEHKNQPKAESVHVDDTHDDDMLDREHPGFEDDDK